VAGEIDRPAWIDITSCLGVQSAFQEVHSDPWGTDLIGVFADAYVKASGIGFPLPVPDGNSSTNAIPPLLHKLGQASPGSVTPHNVLHSQLGVPEGMDVVAVAKGLAQKLYGFEAGEARNARVVRWLAFQKHSVDNTKRLSSSRGQLYDVLKPLLTADLPQLTQTSGLDEDDFLFVLDNIVRTTHYLAIAPDRDTFLLHPLRRLCRVGTEKQARGEVDLNLAFASYGLRWAFSRPSTLTLDKYCDLLARFREDTEIRECLARSDMPRLVNRLRTLAIKLGMPARSNIFVDAIIKEHLTASKLLAASAAVGGVLVLGGVPVAVASFLGVLSGLVADSYKNKIEYYRGKLIESHHTHRLINFIPIGQVYDFEEPTLPEK
jgi:hypothetical protein